MCMASRSVAYVTISFHCCVMLRIIVLFRIAADADADVDADADADNVIIVTWHSLVVCLPLMFLWRQGTAGSACAICNVCRKTTENLLEQILCENKCENGHNNSSLLSAGDISHYLDTVVT